ncbi:MAG: carboxypeptidase-like regulatory domain-containing protein [Winogradskyella sp.]
MKTKHLFITLFVLLSITLNAQNFDKFWYKVETLELNGELKSAQNLVDKIYKKAKKKNNSQQVIKSFIYTSKFNQVLKENTTSLFISSIEKEIAENSFPTNALLENIYANFLIELYKNNSTQINKRPRTSSKYNDIETWSKQDFENEIHKHLQNSLRDKEKLQNEALKAYLQILIGNANALKYRSTLYDYLMHNALNYYKWHNPINVNFFEAYSDSILFSKPKDFTAFNFKTDILISNVNALKIHQELEKLYLKNKAYYKLFDAIKTRFEYIKNTNYNFQYTKDNVDFFTNAITSIITEYKDEEAITVLQFYLAEFYYTTTNDNFIASKGKNAYKKKASLLCNTILEKHPNSEAAIKAHLLLKTINSKLLHFETKNIDLPHKPALAKVTYTNIDTLYVNIYKIPFNTFNNLDYRKKDSLIKRLYITKIPLLKKTYPLGFGNDLHEHSTEILLPKLDLGNYIIVVSHHKSFVEGLDIAYQTTTRSNLQILHTYNFNNNIFEVSHRTIGRPIKNVKLELSETGSNYKINKTTNKNGRVTFNKIEKRIGSINGYLIHKNDTLAIDYINLKRLYKNGNDNTNWTAYTKLILDRKIYRPGQAINFKGYLYQNKNEKRSVVENTFCSIIITDANGNELKEFRLKTNEFGTISGSYQLPKDVLTGEFSIEMDEDYYYEEDEHPFWDNVDDFDYTEVEFFVEDYKRPRFDVKFNPITANYILGDSVFINGQAKSFFNTNISNAKVNYIIESHGDQTIVNQTKTDVNGHFSVVFLTKKSLDQLPKKTTKYFTISVDITDTNGETRSGKKEVVIGNYNLKLIAELPNHVTPKQTHTLKLKAKNLNDGFIASKGTIKIYKNQNTNAALFARDWAMPEYQNIPKTTFKKHFPNLEYQLNKAIKKELVFESKFEINDALELDLETKNFKNGDYSAVIKAYSSINDTVSITRNFNYYNKALGNKRINSIFDFNIENLDYKQDGYIKLKLTSALKNTFVKLKGFSKDKAIYNTIVKVNTDTIVKIPISKYLTGELNFSLYANKENHFKEDSFDIQLTKQDNTFDIEVINFRNKIEPDKEETWTFKIKNLDKNVEVLASMYDESLDDFFKNNDDIYEHDYPLDWELIKDKANWYSSPNINKITSYYNETSKNYTTPYYYNTIKRNYLKLNYFGLSFTNTYANKKYLKVLKDRIDTKRLQLGNVSGIITTAADGLPLPGANVIIKGTNRGTQTDFDGFYSINVNKGETLVFSYIGFKNQEITYNTSNFINVMVVEDSSALEEVVVMGYGVSKKSASITSYTVNYKTKTDFENHLSKLLKKIPYSSFSQILQGQVSGLNISSGSGQPGNTAKIRIRGVSSINGNKAPLFVVDGIPVDKTTFANLDATLIGSVNVLKNAASTSIYGSRGSNGVVLITTKYGTETTDKNGKTIITTITKEETIAIETRKDLKETAFFFPHLTTNNTDKLTFSYNGPQALTRWKLQLFAHTKNMQNGYLKLNTLTQKALVVVPNFPRFLRESDTITLVSKISNLSNNKEITGNAYLQLFNAETNVALAINTNKIFQLKNNETETVSWSVVIPEGVNKVRYKILAVSGNFSDGEEGILDVLKKKILVTETLPVMVNSNSKKAFQLKKLSENSSNTLTNKSLTVEFSANPIWFAFNALPYLMEFPYDCAEQTFSKYYANALGNHILNTNPKIKTYISGISSTTTKLSDSTVNPWSNKNKQNYKLSLLFNKDKLKTQELNTINKLNELQLANGAFSWFSAQGAANNFITRHIVASYGHLKQLGVTSKNQYRLDNMMKKALNYLDNEFAKNTTFNTNTKLQIKRNHIHYLYARSFYLNEVTIKETHYKIINNYLSQLESEWVTKSLYEKGMIALIFNRFNREKTAKKIIKALHQSSIIDAERGMYWKENELGTYWYKAPIETQALLIEAFADIENDTKTLDLLKKWLLSNKQTNSWKTTKATTEAIYALMLSGSDWLTVKENTEIKIGGIKYEDSTNSQLNIGYQNIELLENEIDRKKAKIEINNKSKSQGFGGIYWQYFEDLDKIASAKTPLKLSKKLFLKTNTDKGEEISEITSKTKLKVGDLVRIRIELRTDRSMEFVHLKDMRAAGFEPINVISKYKWQDGLGYYESTKDAATNFFIDYLPKGVFVFEYDLRVNNAGNMSNGISTIQSMYAPEFSSHSDGLRINVID